MKADKIDWMETIVSGLVAKAQSWMRVTGCNAQEGYEYAITLTCAGKGAKEKARRRLGLN